MSILGILEHGLRVDPDKPMLCSDRGAISYAQGVGLVARIANALRARGLGKGDCGSVLAANDPAALLAAYGIQAGGLAYLASSATSTTDEQARALGRFEVNVLFFQGAFADRVAAMRTQLPKLRLTVCLDGEAGDLSLEALVEGQANIYAGPHPMLSDIASISQTGGTTGEPKGVMISHRARVAFVEKFWMEIQDPSPVMLAATPLTHAAGALAQPVFARGGTVHVIERADAALVLNAIERHRISLLFLPPTVIYRVLDHPALASTDLSSLRHLLYGAAPMSVARLREAIRVFGPVMTQFYGQTECHTMITALMPRDHFRGTEVAEDERLASCGRPSLGTTVEIVDEQGARLPPGKVGEIRAHSDLMMSGYFRNPQATEAVLRDGFIHTGDLGYIDHEGYLHLVDRKRDLIITGGFNVYPSEVEQVLASHPAVAECAVVGAPDADWGERVTAVVELRVGASASTEDLQAFCRDRLGGVKSPKVVEIWPSLPRSAIGKVLRKDIRMRFWPVGSRQI